MLFVCVCVVRGKLSDKEKGGGLFWDLGVAMVYFGLKLGLEWGWAFGYWITN